MKKLYRLELTRKLKKENQYDGIFRSPSLKKFRNQLERIYPLDPDCAVAELRDWVGYAFENCLDPYEDPGLKDYWHQAVIREKEASLRFAFENKDSLIACCGLLDHEELLTQFEKSFELGLVVVELEAKNWFAGHCQAVFDVESVVSIQRFRSFDCL